MVCHKGAVNDRSRRTRFCVLPIYPLGFPRGFSRYYIAREFVFGLNTRKRNFCPTFSHRSDDRSWTLRNEWMMKQRRKLYSNVLSGSSTAWQFSFSFASNLPYLPKLMLYCIFFCSFEIRVTIRPNRKTMSGSDRIIILSLSSFLFPMLWHSLRRTLYRYNRYPLGDRDRTTAAASPVLTARRFSSILKSHLDVNSENISQAQDRRRSSISL